jgi:phosphotransferase system enzyme I (PtsI)
MTFSGKSVLKAIAIGPVLMFRKGSLDVEQSTTDNPGKDVERLHKAMKQAQDELEALHQKALSTVGKEQAEIFEIHKMMVEDEDLNDAILNGINDEKYTAEYAVYLAGKQFAKMFSEMDDEYMRARSADVLDVATRIVAILQGKKDALLRKERKSVICADDLSPSETISLDRDSVLAFVLAGGSVSSHTAILARSMGIPAIVGTGEACLALHDGDEVIVDGFSGSVTVHPSKEELSSARAKEKEMQAEAAYLMTLVGKPSVTKSGRKISICANIGSPKQMPDVLAGDADGIGLYRSEFLYLDKTDYPTEEEQFEAYKQVLVQMPGKKVIIRTMDIGADKQVGYFHLDKEENPALGLRAIRICLERPELFTTQLRALYRASVFGELGIMFPMIASESEVLKIKAICKEVRDKLTEGHVPFSSHVELGIMIETPAAAIISDKLAPLVDFFSIGTNDLTQYTLAIDRQNTHLAPFLDTHHEAVLCLISLSARNAHAAGKWSGICGELAADPSLTEFFLDQGIDELSMAPPSVLKIRDVVRKSR